jgi:hypothetical protein
LITKERVLNFDSPFLSAKLAGYKRSPAHGHLQADTDQESKPRPYPSGGPSCLFSLLMMKFQGMQCTILKKINFFILLFQQKLFPGICLQRTAPKQTHINLHLRKNSSISYSALYGILIVCLLMQWDLCTSDLTSCHLLLCSLLETAPSTPASGD